MSTKFLSYAQNNEDVLLWRALGHVQDGFYIDVGANDPVEHSVTKAFYDAGWHGINIEPLPAFHQLLSEQRPRDINLILAAGSSDGTLTLYDVPGVNGWASPEREVAEAHRAEGHELRELTVPVRTMASICAEHVQGEIHFMKIDVEGFEGEVLRGMDFERWRPWVLVVEATMPGRRETNHETWEHLVLGHRYRYAWFDGLNRYYVAEEHPELMQHFGVQPNVFDGFISYHLEKAWAANRVAVRSLEGAALSFKEQDKQTDIMRTELHDMIQFAQQLEMEKQDVLNQVEQLRRELAAAHASSHHLSEWARGLEERVNAMASSTSWKLTMPLRAAGSLLIRLRRPGLTRRAMLRATRSQRLRRVLIPILLRYPPLGRRVSAMLQAARQTTPLEIAPGIEVPSELRSLPASVRGVLGDLQKARELRSEPKT
jgi:FkbM family methyltransferase